MYSLATRSRRLLLSLLEALALPTVVDAET